MLLRIIFALCGILLLVAGLGGIKALQIRSMIAAGESFQLPPEAVTTAVVSAQSWEETIPAIASLRADQGVTLAAQIGGPVVEILFDSGAQVASGAVLLRQDVSEEIAERASIQARLNLAEISLRRMRDLVAAQTAPVAELDAAEATIAQARADLARIEAVIEKKTLRAPFAGRLGLRTVNLGQYLQPGEAIVSLQALSVLRADFKLPQQRVGELRQGLPVRFATDALPGRPVLGEIRAVEPEVNSRSRNLLVEASLPNPDESLKPGMWGTLEVVTLKADPVLAIPSSSILYAPYGDSVYVVEERQDESGALAKTVRLQSIRVGRRLGDLVAITQGLKEGETVVSTGAFKLRPGASIIVRNDIPVPSETAPRPDNT